MSSPNEEKTKPKRKLSKKRLILLSVVGVFILGCLIGGGILMSIINDIPPFDPGKLTHNDLTSFIYDKDNNEIGKLHANENREMVEYKDIPELVRKSFVTVEDIRFNDHYGVDPMGIARAFYKKFTGGNVEGGSTITIQLARGAFLSRDQNYTRKIQEAVIALKLERLYTKDEILTFYLNRSFFGRSAYGIKAAAKTYFGKDITKDKLTIAEVAMLTGLPQAPSAYDPFLNPEKAKWRRTVVLQVLRDNKVITQEEYEKAKDEPFEYVEKLKKENKTPGQNGVKVSYSFPYFVDYTIDELVKEYGISEDAIYSGGLKIYTTVDSKIQQAAEAVYADPSKFPKDVKGVQAESAMVIMSPQDGSVRAMVGGRNYRTARDINRAWYSLRQPGSTIKPLAVYAPALEKGGYFTGTVLDNMPVAYKGADGKLWKPTNFDSDTKGWNGLITMREALRNSVNIYAIKLLEKIGIDYGFQFAKDKFGLPLTDNDKVLALALGSPSVSVLDMVTAYSAFPNGGLRPKAHGVLKVVDSKGAILVDNSNIEKRRILKEQTAYLINDMLRTVVTSGTGAKAQFGKWAVAGKTGTTSLKDDKTGQGLRDAWFVGYTPEYVGAVWMGFDTSKDANGNETYHLASNEYGGGKPALIWNQVMKKAHEGLEVKSKFERPSGISSIAFDRKSGLAPSSLTPSQFISTDLAIQGSLPSGTSDVWVEMEVCADTGLLPGPNTKNKITKVFLNVNRDGINEPWPEDEAPYKPPTATCTMESAAPPPPASSATVQFKSVSYADSKISVNVLVNGTAKVSVIITDDKGKQINTWVTPDAISGEKTIAIPVTLAPGKYSARVGPQDSDEPDKFTTKTFEVKKP